MCRTGPARSATRSASTAAETRARAAAGARRWPRRSVARCSPRSAFIAVSTLGTVGGPLLVRYGIDHGIRDGDAGALDLAVVALLRRRRSSPTSAGASSTCSINRAGEGFLRDPAHPRVRPHPAPVAGLLRPQQVGRARVADDRRHRVAWPSWCSGAAAVRRRRRSCWCSRWSCCSSSRWQLTLVALMVLPIIIVASIKFQRDSNAAYLEVRERVGQNLSALQEGISGVRVIQAYAREPEQRRRFAQSNRALYDSHLHSVRVVDVVLRAGRVLRRARHRAGDRRRRLARAPRRPIRSAPSSPSCCCSPACSSRCSSSRSCTTPCSRRPRRCTSCSRILDTDPDGRRARRRRSSLPRARRSRRRRRHVLVPRHRRRPALVDVSLRGRRRASVWRSSARPAPASRRSPS